MDSDNLGISAQHVAQKHPESLFKDHRWKIFLMIGIYIWNIEKD